MMMIDIIQQLYELFGYDPTTAITTVSDLVHVIIQISLGTALVGFTFGMLTKIMCTLLGGGRRL